jgi:hyperosmotically inducible periplasmic protein
MEEMKMKKFILPISLGLAMLAIGGCSETPKSPDVSDSIRKSFDQAGLNDVSVSQDRDKGVVTLTGTVTSDSDKSRAESIAKAIAGNQVVADQIAVRPPGAESMMKKVDSDTDSGIEKNFDAMLVQQKLDKNVKYSAKNGVLTLTGEVNSQAKRSYVEKLAGQVPNVKQVVNELQVKNQKATASN